MAEHWKTEFIYSDKDIEELASRATNDRICRIAYNIYKLNKNDVYKELYYSLLAKLKTDITDKVKKGTLNKSDTNKLSKALVSLFALLPTIIKGMNELEKMAKINPTNEEAVKENLDINDLTMNIRKEKGI